MGKSEVDLGDDIDEINEHAEAIAAAATRLEKQSSNSTRSSVAHQGKAGKRTNSEVSGVGNCDSGQVLQTKPAHELKVIDGKENGAPRAKGGRRRPEKNSKQGNLSTDSQLSVNDDPWVTDSVKVRHSKKRRLKELSLRRELNRDSPYQKKDLIDEALDYIFSKYEKR